MDSITLKHITQEKQVRMAIDLAYTEGKEAAVEAVLLIFSNDVRDKQLEQMMVEMIHKIQGVSNV